jgi:hypothetical protein
MVNWGTLWAWPISKGISQLVSDTTRVVSNYHWAVEAWSDEFIASHADWAMQCVQKAPPLPISNSDSGLSDWVEATIQDSNSAAASFVPAVVDAFGPDLKAEGIHISAGEGREKTQDSVIRARNLDAVRKLEFLLCDRIQAFAGRTLALFEFVRQEGTP